MILYLIKGEQIKKERTQKKIISIYIYIKKTELAPHQEVPVFLQQVSLTGHLK